MDGGTSDVQAREDAQHTYAVRTTAARCVNHSLPATRDWSCEASTARAKPSNVNASKSGASGASSITGPPIFAYQHVDAIRYLGAADRVA